MRERKQAYFLPADPDAVWGKDGEGNRVLITRIENLIDAGEISPRVRTAGGVWYDATPASSLSLMRHLSALNTQLDAARDEATRFSLQARRDLAYETLCKRAKHN